MLSIKPRETICTKAKVRDANGHEVIMLAMPRKQQKHTG